jgi:hypothetical protein
VSKKIGGSGRDDKNRGPRRTIVHRRQKKSRKKKKEEEKKVKAAAHKQGRDVICQI